MADVDIDTALDWRGRTVVDRDGEKIGTFEEIYLEEGTDRPEWAAVRTGLFGIRQTFIPLSEATLAGEEVQVPYERELVKKAPNIDPDVALSAAEETALYQHYGRPHADAAAQNPGGRSPEDEHLGAPTRDDEAERRTVPDAPEPGLGAGEEAEGRDQTTPAGGVGEDPGAGPDENAGEAPKSSVDLSRPAMAGSEEDVHIRNDSRPTEGVKLKKYVVTDYVTKRVPVQREEVRPEREDVSDADGGS